MIFLAFFFFALKSNTSFAASERVSCYLLDCKECELKIDPAKKTAEFFDNESSHLLKLISTTAGRLRFEVQPANDGSFVGYRVDYNSKEKNATLFELQRGGKALVRELNLKCRGRP